MANLRWPKGQVLLRPIEAAILLFTGVTFALRLVHLQADFPEGLTWSNAPYSDEGWYSSAAISYHLRGSWHVEGDFNPAVNLPVLPLVQALMFQAFGMSLATARLTIVGFFVLLLASVLALVRAVSSIRTALIAAALLAVNFHTFAFSRMALLEIPMTSLLVLSLALAVSGSGDGISRPALAGMVLGLAVLTKTTALFALPALIYLVWRENLPLRQNMLRTLATIAVIAAVLLGHLIWARLNFPADYAYFNSLNLEPRLHIELRGLARNLLRTLWHGRVIGPVLYFSTLLPLPIFLLISKQFRRHRLAIASLLWMAGYVFTLAVRGYLPPRYYVALSVPVVFLFTLMTLIAIKRLQPRRLAFIPAAALALVAGLHLWRIVDHLRSPQFSLIEAAAAISRRVGPDGGPIMGGMANTLSLATGLPAINSTMGTRELEWKVNRYQPKHVLTLGTPHELLADLEQMGELEEVASYDLFGNYSRGRQTHMYRLTLDSN